MGVAATILALIAMFVCYLIWARVPEWKTPRFSLRTPLIATTLVAVILGLVVWAAN